jgi:hypothetical protein
MKAFDLDVCMKEYGGKCVTRDGRSARIICADRLYTQPLATLVFHREGGYEVMYSHNADGSFTGEKDHYLDLFLPMRTVTRKGWINVYPNQVHAYVYLDIESAAKNAQPGRIACVEIEYSYEE